jgi:PrtD family type I secretion system ABC transporter
LSNEAVASFFDVPFVPIFIFVIWALHPALGTVAIVSTILIAILSVLTDRRAKGKLAAAEPKHAEASARSAQYARQAETLKAHGMVNIAADRWWDSRAEAERLDLPGQDGLNDSQGVLKAAMFFFPVILLCVGAFLVMDGVLGVGAMVAGNILMMRTVAPVQMALTAWKQFVEARTSLNQLDEFLGEHATYQKSIQATLPEPKVEVLVEKLVSRPPSRGAEPILKGFSFKILPGETVGVIGASGAGKSTLLKHLVGLQVPLKGHVKFDQIPAWQWDSAVLGEHIGFMGQDSELFEGSIAENIARFTDCDAAEVTRAAEIAGVHHRIAQLPNGYDTPITTGKVTLSGGEKQAVALARTVFRLPKLVVLDEPTASMDSKGQEAVKFCIQQLKAAGTTVVVSSHQTPLLNGLDKLLFIQFGKQVAYGPADDVIPKIRKAG